MTSTKPSSRPTAAAKALTAWTELNDRQQGTLAVIYSLDQAAEQEHQQRGARGDFDPRPASQWRALEFAHDPADRRLFGRTTMQVRLAAAGWDNQGNGSGPAPEVWTP
ncbi:hypothetical protein AB0J71_47345 [Nonomuraea sp. NPDC049637]|uniref:hypothetical protein n=1 Tax=Nonomuraea sp. NPDC049637 TaxID=3154356 RepID=UPI003443CC2D